MDLPFKLGFSQTPTKYPVEKYSINNFNYVKSESELFDIEENNIPVVIENLPLRLKFDSNDVNARLYIDVFDSLPLEQFNLDDKDVPYLSPENEEFIIFDNGNGKFLTLVPGFYKICVLSKGTWYYTFFKVTSRQIDEVQWIAMRDEIEDFVKNLARDVLQKRIGNEISNIGGMSLDLLNKLKLIKDNFKVLKMALENIKHSPKYRVKREYLPKYRSQITFVDPIVIKSLTKKTNNGKVLAAANVIQFDLPENRKLKFYINSITVEIKKLLYSAKLLEINIEKEISSLKIFSNPKNALTIERLNDALNTLKEYKAVLNKIYLECIDLMEMDFMLEVSNQRVDNVSIAFERDFYYQKIRDFYELLRNKTHSIELSLEYSYYWKVTDKLYEIWGFIQFIKWLKDSNFKFDKISGWIFSLSPSEIETTVPFLNEGTKVIFEKDSLRIELVYDTPLPYKSVPLKVCPLHAESSKNRPDLRVDVYDDQYIGSIIIDFKYRRLNDIWSGQFNSKEQLLAYKNSIVSKHFFTDSPLKRVINAVREVWAVYPGNSNNSAIPSNDERIKLIDLTPLDDNQMFMESVSEGLNKLIEEAQLIKSVSTTN